MTTLNNSELPVLSEEDFAQALAITAMVASMSIETIRELFDRAGLGSMIEGEQDPAYVRFCACCAFDDDLIPRSWGLDKMTVADDDGKARAVLAARKMIELGKASGSIPAQSHYDSLVTFDGKSLDPESTFTHAEYLAAKDGRTVH